jgi:hypothetical protein
MFHVFYKGRSMQETLMLGLLALSFVVYGANVTLPASFEIPSNYSLALKLFAVGTQNYKCNGTKWTLNNADAELWLNAEAKGKPDGIHYFLEQPDANGGRPTWDSYADQSEVTVKLLRSDPGPSPDKNIAWLQTTRTSVRGQGVFSAIEMVLRVNTEGGLAPSTACSDLDKVSIPYKSEYWYYKLASNNTSSATETTTEKSEASSTAKATSVPTEQGVLINSADMASGAGTFFLALMLLL